MMGLAPMARATLAAKICTTCKGRAGHWSPSASHSRLRLLAGRSPRPWIGPEVESAGTSHKVRHVMRQGHPIDDLTDDPRNPGQQQGPQQVPCRRRSIRRRDEGAHNGQTIEGLAPAAAFFQNRCRIRELDTADSNARDLAISRRLEGRENGSSTAGADDRSGVLLSAAVLCVSRPSGAHHQGTGGLTPLGEVKINMKKIKRE